MAARIHQHNVGPTIRRLAWGVFTLSLSLSFSLSLYIYISLSLFLFFLCVSAFFLFSLNSLPFLYYVISFLSLLFFPLLSRVPFLFLVFSFSVPTKSHAQSRSHCSTLHPESQFTRGWVEFAALSVATLSRGLLL